MRLTTSVVRGDRRGPSRLLALGSTLALIMSLIAVYAPTASAEHANEATYQFQFVNGQTLSGTHGPGGDAPIPPAFFEAYYQPDSPPFDHAGLTIHVSCSDPFSGGWAGTGFPNATNHPEWQIASYSIVRHTDGTVQECGESSVQSNPEPVQISPVQISIDSVCRMDAGLGPVGDVTISVSDPDGQLVSIRIDGTAGNDHVWTPGAGPLVLLPDDYAWQAVFVDGYQGEPLAGMFQVDDSCLSCPIPGAIDLSGTRTLIRGGDTGGPVSVDIAAGLYHITLASYDHHSTKPNQGSQTEEIWAVTGLGFRSPSTDDLPGQDGNANPVNFKIYRVTNGENWGNDQFGPVLVPDLTEVSTLHTGPPRKVNSVQPVCALFEPVVVDILPQISVTKTADPVSLPEPGGEVEFTVEISNPSAEESVTITSIVDDLFGSLAGDAGCTVGTTLAPGESCRFTFTETLSGNAGDRHRNTVTVTGEDPEGNRVADQDDAVVDFTDVLPAIAVTKTADPGIVFSGSGVEFTIVITNQSAADPLEITSIEDDVFGTLAGGADCRVGTILAPGASCRFSFVETLVGGDGDRHRNTVTVTGEDDEGNRVSAQDDAVVDIRADVVAGIVDVFPEIAVTKTASVGSVVEPGANVDFTVVVTNPSDEEPVTITSLRDNVYGALAGDADCRVGTTLAPRQSCQFVFTGFVGGTPDQTHRNVVTVVGEDAEGNVVSASDDAVVEIDAADQVLGVEVLPFTGSDADQLFALSLALLGIGAGLISLARRRQPA